MEIRLQPPHIGPLLHNLVECVGTVGVADFGVCCVGILLVRLLHTTALTSVPCAGYSSNQDLAPSTFPPSNSGSSFSTLLELT